MTEESTPMTSGFGARSVRSSAFAMLHRWHFMQNLPVVLVIPKELFLEVQRLPTEQKL